jgi:hypothetical protein
MLQPFPPARAVIVTLMPVVMPMAFVSISLVLVGGGLVPVALFPVAVVDSVLTVLMRGIAVSHDRSRLPEPGPLRRAGWTPPAHSTIMCV